MKYGKYNTFQIQTPGTNLRGQLCFYVLHQLHQGEPFSSILLDFGEAMNAA